MANRINRIGSSRVEVWLALAALAFVSALTCLFLGLNWAQLLPPKWSFVFRFALLCFVVARSFWVRLSLSLEWPTQLIKANANRPSVCVCRGCVAQLSLDSNSTKSPNRSASRNRSNSLLFRPLAASKTNESKPLVASSSGADDKSRVGGQQQMSSGAVTVALLLATPLLFCSVWFGSVRCATLSLVRFACKTTCVFCFSLNTIATTALSAKL